MILLDTSGLLAAIDSSERFHREAAQAVRSAEPPLLLSPFVLAELGYLLATRIGSHAEISLLQEVADGAYELEQFDRDDVAAAIELIAKYPGIDLGLADASIVVLANRYGISDVLTLDQRHFRTVTRKDGRPFRILPFDEPV